MSDSTRNDRDPTATIVGIDEAGYGPLLGPLVVSAVAFDVPASLLGSAQDGGDGPDLWKILSATIARKPNLRRPRLAVADSKLLHGKVETPTGVGLLERAALTFLAVADRRPTTLRGLLRVVCPDVLPALAEYPWYTAADIELPVDCSPGDIATQANALRGNMTGTGVRFLGAWVEVLPEGHFNRLVGATHNKAVVLFTQNARLMQRIADRLGHRTLHIWADRHGGRTSYLRPLMRAFDDAQLEVVDESPERSSYRLTRPCGCWNLRFVTKGETRHLPIALASIFSKYIRELFMACFNRYWCGQMPDLRPTAGYSQDGRRFLSDIGSILERQGLDRTRLVRLL